MFRKSRIKLIIYIMAMLVVVLAGIIAIIYFTTYRELNTENRLMLEIYAEQYEQYGAPDDDASSDNGVPADLPESGSEDESSDSGSDLSADDSSGSIADEGFSSSDGPQEDSSSESSGLSRETGIDTGNATPEELAESSERKKYMVSTFYSVAFSEDGTALEVNNETESGLDDEALTGLAALILEKNREFGTYEDIVYLITETDEYILVTMMDNTVLGETIDSLIKNTIIFGSVGLIVLFIISLIITRWIILPLETGYKKQKQFISDAGHELKTPVSTIAANSELLAREIGENQWLSNIRYENGRMGDLVKQLLDLARLESTEAEHTKVDLSRICLMAVLPFEGIAFEKGFKLDYDIKDDITINGNKAQLEQLASVLIDNALDHTNPGGEIKITLSCSHSNAVFTVANEGPEIPPNERELIFDRFYRSDTARTKEDAHYGLGLSIARAIVISHKGKISVDCSDGITRFKAVLPVK